MESRRNRSLGTALAKIDAQTMRAWVNRWTSLEGATHQNGPRLVRIDAEILARRHPAWRLADALEAGTISPSAPQIARELDLAEPGAIPPNGRLGALDGFGAMRILPAVTLRDKAAISVESAKQSAALYSFFRAAAARDRRREADEAFLSRRALEDAIAAARNRAVPELDLSQIPPEVALELTNLRLQLLRNLSKTPAQRAAAREEIRRIEARINQVWREETARQAARIRAARVDLPNQMRRAEQERIARQARSETQQRAAARRAVERETLNLLRPDVRADAALRLDLPPAHTLSPPDFTPSSALESRALRPDAQFFETAARRASSQALTSKEREAVTNSRIPFARSKRSTPATIAILRQKARSQAAEWAQLVAGNLGATRTDLSGAPDATEAALEILFPGARR